MTGEPCPDPTSLTEDGFPVIDMTPCAPDTTVIQPPPWEPVTVGAETCPDWMIYHTDQTGDWEIFRLGDLPSGVIADPNLSRGIGAQVFDIMPALSPDRQYITFTSNREGNWEIYISAVESDDIRRVTYNTFAVDLDPVWSPVGNDIVYGSNRDGHWELYMFDVTTGEEARLTQTLGNNVNPTWSPDGTRILYQSDIDGFWQIYEYDIATNNTRLLSDGTGDDHDPLYSPDGQSIVFRSYRDGTGNSALYTMDADGGSITRITDPAFSSLYGVWSPDNTMIAFQSNAQGDEDVYVYDVATGTTRLITDNDIEDYAPTWICDSPILVYTSDVTGDPNLFQSSGLATQPIDVLTEASQLTFLDANDRYPVSAPPEDKASREDTLPSPVINR